jgi:hypothetical protein
VVEDGAAQPEKVAGQNVKARRTVWLAWAWCSMAIALAIYRLVQGLRVPGAPSDALSIANGILNAGFVVVFGFVGALIVGRQPRNNIGWLLMVIALAFAVPDFGGTAATAAAPSAPTLINLFAAWLSGWSWWLLMGPLLLILLLFPTGRPPTSRWHWAVVSLTVCFLIFMLIGTFAKSFDSANGTQVLPNPIGLLSDDAVSVLLLPWEALLLVNVVLCVSAIFVRYHHAALVERQQIKWLLSASSFFLLAFAASAIFRTTYSEATGILFDIAVLTIPIAIGIAIVRYRLWDIDVIIRRTLVYALLTALLALAYFGSVLLLQGTFSVLTGQRQSTLVTVFSTLVIAALFVPLRWRVQAVIDRRLFRRKYDAAHTLAAFGASLRDETNLDELAIHLAYVVDETMQPKHLRLWLKTERPEQRARQ